MAFNYWEEYAGQDVSQFTHIGVDTNIQVISDVDKQVKEFQRVYGRDCNILLYREEE